MALDKIQKTEKLIAKLKRIAEKAIFKEDFEKALSALSACANVLYEYNQKYKDDEVEDMLLVIGRQLLAIPDEFIPKDEKPVKTVLYYDGFGLDLRGLAANSTKIIASLGYKLIYVTNERARYTQLHIRQELEGFDVEYVYINMSNSYVKWVKDLNAVFLTYAPQVAYFYTQPFDVAGAVVFNQYKGRVTRLLVNLTDHAYWIGLNAFDYCSAGRAMGAWINLKGRGIPLEKMYNIRTNVFVNEKAKLSPLPFDMGKYRYIFSGGALYKTLGDPNIYFYKIIEHIVTTYSDVNFLYAGEGDTSEFDKLINKYPDRVFLFHEREDFYQIIQGSVFYLNTYPMFGGQMMRYAAYAKKLPVTLKHNDDGEGILYHQKELDIEFDTYEEVLEEIDRLLTDDEYRQKKESKLSLAVVSKEDVQKDYKQIIETQVSPVSVIEEEFDTTQFQREYIDRLDFRKIQELSIGKKINYPLMPYFPGVFLRRLRERLR